MRKLLTVMILMLSVFSYAQTSNDSIVSNTGVYVSGGLSIGNSTGSDFEHTSYPSVEAGVYKDNLSLGLVVGRGNLANFGQEFKGSNIQNYWYEVKTAVSQPIGITNGYVLFGLGNYIDTSNIFIEYGFGLNYTPNKVGYFVQASNWDGLWYNTVGVSLNL